METASWFSNSNETWGRRRKRQAIAMQMMPVKNYISARLAKQKQINTKQKNHCAGWMHSP
jgi:hypothetical protein